MNRFGKLNVAVCWALRAWLLPGFFGVFWEYSGRVQVIEKKV
jgi:hypothetical protein